MTITLERKQDTWCCLAAGHAGTAPKGQDLACAAVSILLYTLVQSLRRLQSRGQGLLKEELLAEGRAEVVFRSGGKGAAEVFAVIADGLKLLAAGYPAHIHLHVCL